MCCQFTYVCRTSGTVGWNASQYSLTRCRRKRTEHLTSAHKHIFDSSILIRSHIRYGSISAHAARTYWSSEGKMWRKTKWKGKIRKYQRNRWLALAAVVFIVVHAVCSFAQLFYAYQAEITQFTCRLSAMLPSTNPFQNVLMRVNTFSVFSCTQHISPFVIYMRVRNGEKKNINENKNEYEV